MSAYHGSDQPRDDMIYWHDRWFPAATGRLLGPDRHADQLRESQAAPRTEPRRRTTPSFRRHRHVHPRGIRRSGCRPRGPPHASRPNRALGPKAKRRSDPSPEREARRSHPSRRRRTGTREQQHAVTGRGIVSCHARRRRVIPDEDHCLSSRCGLRHGRATGEFGCTATGGKRWSAVAGGSRRGINRSRIPQITL